MAKTPKKASSKKAQPQSAYLILVRHPPKARSVHDLEVLLGIKCQQAGKPPPTNVGQLVFPGGKFAKRDKKVLLTSRREGYEETGLYAYVINAKPISFVDEGMQDGKLVNKKRNFFLAVPFGGTLEDSKELANTGWAPIGTVLTRATPAVAPRHLRGLRLMLDAGYFDSLLHPFPR